MTRMFREWWRYGRRRWGWRNYALHFGLVYVAVLVITMHTIAIASHA